MEQKRREGKQRFLKKGGGGSKLGQGVGDLKSRGAGTPLRTMRLGLEHPYELCVWASAREVKEVSLTLHRNR